MARHPFSITAAAVFILCAMAASAQAQEYGVVVQGLATSSFAEPGCSAGNSVYTTAAGFAAGQTTTGAGGCANASSGPGGTGLTTATVSASSSISAGPSPSTIATANLATASLHAVAQANAGGEALLVAQWWDTLTFNVGGSNPVSIPVTFSVDGSFTPSPGVPEGGGGTSYQNANVTAVAQIQSGAANCSSALQYQGECVSSGPNASGSAQWSVSTSDSNGSNVSVIANSDGLITWDGTPATSTPTNFLEGGTLVLDPGMDVINVGAEIDMEALVGTLDFGDTASLSFDLPPGVTYSSASEVFDTSSAVPEPASLALLASALAGCAASRRRRGLR